MDSSVCRLGSSDRLSSLPIELIYKVLKYVPMRDVVKTSLLSRFWRYKWMFVPDLVFDAHSLLPTTSKEPQDFVNHVLLLHNHEISRFEINNYLNPYCPDVHQWLLLLQKKMVKELILDLPWAINRVKLSSSIIFSCQTLTILKLTHCSLNFPFCAKSLPNLFYIDLRYVTFVDDTIASLISNSPSLQRLFFIGCDGFTRLNIHAPNLRTFGINSSYGTINFGNTPMLEVAHIQLRSIAENRRYWLDDNIGGLVNVKKLHLYAPSVKVILLLAYIVASMSCLLVITNISFPFTPNFQMLAVMVPKGVGITFGRLKYILLYLNFGDSKAVLTSLRLFRAAPCLQAMDVNIYSREPMRHTTESFEVQLDEKVIFPRLETVSLSQFKGTEIEMRFVEFILLNAVVLETMKVNWHVSYISNHQLKADLLEKMILFERTSPRAKVIFKQG